MASADDPEVLDRALSLGRVTFSKDDDFLREAARRQRTGEPFAGVIYAHQLRVSIAKCIEDLELLAAASNPDEFQGHVLFLPLR